MKADNTAEKIAAVALAILEKEGAEAVTMRRVADAVGITPMAIYHHFPDRQMLLTFVTDREFEKLVDLMRANMRGLPRNATPATRVLRVMDYYVDYSFARPRVFDYVFSRHRDDARRFPDDFRAGRSPTMNLVAETVGEAMQAGVIRKDDKWEVAMDLWAFAHGYVALYRAGRFALDEAAFRALLRRSFKRFMDGLRS
jgi:AcrR family transcriptional regulator